MTGKQYTLEEYKAKISAIRKEIAESNKRAENPSSQKQLPTKESLQLLIDIQAQDEHEINILID